MSETREIAAVDKLKNMIGMEYIQKKFMEILGERAPSFLASVLNAVQMTPALRDAEPKSVLTAAMAAAVIDLPVDKNLGFAAIVPYKEKGRPLAQFQIMTRGYVQLAQRSGQYADINVTEVYEDEIEGYDILSGSVKLNPAKNGWREKSWDGDVEAEKHIAGYAATIRLLSGFQKIEYWPVKKIDAHGKRFSKSFENASSPWKTNLAAMRAKTVLKNTISRWGPLSIQLQRAVNLDQRVAQPTFGNGSVEETMDFDDNPETDSSPVAQEVKSETPNVTQEDPTPQSPDQETKPEPSVTKTPENATTDSPEKTAFLNQNRQDSIKKLIALFDSPHITEEERKGLNNLTKPRRYISELWELYEIWTKVVAERAKAAEVTKTAQTAQNPAQSKLQTKVAELDAVVNGAEKPLAGTVVDDTPSLGIF